MTSSNAGVGYKFSVSYTLSKRKNNVLQYGEDTRTVNTRHFLCSLFSDDYGIKALSMPYSVSILKV